MTSNLPSQTPNLSVSKADTRFHWTEWDKCFFHFGVFCFFWDFFSATMPKGRWLANKCVLLWTQCSTLALWNWLLGASEEFTEEKRGSKKFSCFNCYKVVTQQKLISAILVIPHLLRLVSALNSSCQVDWEKFIGLA